MGKLGLVHRKCILEDRADFPIDLGAGGHRSQLRADQCGQVAHRLREVPFVQDADEIALAPHGADDLRGGREQ
jgi:hypothetical protein